VKTMKPGIRRFWPATASLLIVAAMGAALAIAASDETRPAPVAIPPSRPMSDLYRVLLVRSIFNRDHNRAAAVVGRTPAAAVDPSASAAAQTEAGLTLFGVSTEDGSPIAFFKNSLDQQIIRVHVGGALARGVISAITLDGVDYVAAGTRMHVNVEETLAGGQVVAAVPATEPAVKTGPTERLGGEKPSWWRHSR